MRTLNWLWRGFLFFVLFAFALNNRHEVDLHWFWGYHWQAPMVMVVLVVGLLVSIFQAATQIHEQTLSFVPKLLAAFATLAVAGPWMLTKLVEYIQQVLQSIPSVVG